MDDPSFGLPLPHIYVVVEVLDVRDRAHGLEGGEREQTRRGQVSEQNIALIQAFSLEPTLSQFISLKDINESFI